MTSDWGWGRAGGAVEEGKREMGERALGEAGLVAMHSQSAPGVSSYMFMETNSKSPSVPWKVSSHPPWLLSRVISG